MKTYSAKPADVVHEWFVVDADDMVLGRLATRIATVLRGKHKPTFTPHVDTGDYVVVVNAANVKLTGNKLDAKKYYRHSGFVGGLKSSTAREVLEKDPTRILRQAVKGMLPKNKLGNELISKLKIYPGAEHPHAGQQPKPFPSHV
jgi:large subunit ribosomal protein L13